jgi:hypothetical protein
MKNKKTPSDFATTSGLTILNTIVAVTALTGLTSNIIPKASAQQNDETVYNVETQKSQNGSITNLWTNTNGRVNTSCYSFPGQVSPSTDDSDTYSDSDS